MRMRTTTLALAAALAGCYGNNLVGSQPAPIAGDDLTIQLGPFDVPQGTEVQLCRTMHLPNDAFAAHRVRLAGEPGLHHAWLYRSTLDFPDEIFDCWPPINLNDWQPVAMMSNGFDWTLPDGRDFVFQPNDVVLLQEHFVNVTTVQAPLDANGAAILSPGTPPAGPTGIVLTMVDENRSISLPPHTMMSTFRKDCVFSQAAYVIALIGGMNARGLQFSVDHVDGTGTDLGAIYDSHNWDNQPFVTYPNSSTPGDSLNGVLVKTGETLRYFCSYDNDTDQTITWGSHADINERCDLVFHYTLLDGAEPLECLAPSGGGW
jgi:hypothetical protein